MKLIVDFWNKFWFEPVSPAPLCLFRICFGTLVLISALLWLPDLLAYFGPKGMVSVTTIQQFEKGLRFSILFMSPQSETLVVTLYLVLVISAIAVTVGFITRASLIVLFLTLVSFHHRDAAILHSGDTLLRIFNFLLIFSPCGEMFSFDKRHIPLESQWEIKCNCWTQRLLQLQLAAVYCQTSLAKSVGHTWWDGTAVYYAVRLQEFQKFSTPYLFDQLWTCRILTYSTLAIEGSLWTLVWFRKTRYIVLAAGLVMHLGIDWTMNIPLFEYTMIIAYLNFLDASDLRKISQILTRS
ncbi:MAG TPA: HTTM domain-containing protein [Drouetiella sp.]